MDWRDASHRAASPEGMRPQKHQWRKRPVSADTSVGGTGEIPPAVPLAPGQDVLEFLLDLLSQLGRRPRHDGETIEHLERPAGVDDGPGTGRAAARDARVERTAPHLADDVDVLGRIAARAYCPPHVEQVGGID